MLGKLMKYEMQAMGRAFLPLYGALLAIALINRVLSALNLSLPLAIGGTLYGLLIGAICVLTLVLTLQRFRKNLLGDEGYLMFTLPVSVDSLIMSKLLAAFIWSMLSMVVLGISVLVISAGHINFNISWIPEAIAHLKAETGVTNLDLTLFTIEGIALMFFMSAGSIATFYACISLSMLVNRRRGLFSFGAYVALFIVWNIISFQFMKILENFYHSLGSISSVHFFALICIGFSLICFLTCYFITRYMLQRKLNLE